MNTFQNLIIEQTSKTPQIELNNLTGDLIFSGKSTPENAAKVFEPVLNWVSEYIKNPRPTTNLRLDLDYFNTASTIWLVKMLKILIKINEPAYNLIIHLYFPVEDFDEINEFEDIKDYFYPIADIVQGAIPCVCIKLYEMDENSVVVRDTLVFIESGKFTSLKSA